MKLLKICYNGTSKVKGEKLMTNKYYYNPKIFDIDSIEAAKNIILTKEDTLDTNSRWESETNFLIDSIASFFKLDENMTILDYGCGIGRVSKGLIEKYNCKVIGVDISESMRSQAIDYVNNKNFKAIDPSELKSLINSGFKVDAAISIWVIQHSPKPFEDILLLKNIIKKDGLLYVLNNKISAVPTNKGWVDNGINIHHQLKKEFEELKSESLPVNITSKKISEYTFISFLKNNKGNITQMNEEILLKEALSLYKNKNLSEAKNKYLEVLQINPNNIEANLNLGVIVKILGNVPEAIKYYIKVIKLDSKNKFVYNNIGNAFKEVKDYKMAIKAYSDSIKLNPNDFNAYNNLGIVYELIGDNNKAIAAYKQAVKVNPKHAKSINNIGVVLYKQKKYEQSAQIFEIALQTDPDYTEVYSNKGAAYNKAKNYDKAIESLEMAILKMPNHGGAYTNLGNVYNKLFDYKTAAKMHEKSIELEPNGSNAYSNLGTSYKYLGLSDKAIISYKKAIELDPNFVNAHFDLATMYLASEDFKNGWKEYEWRFKKEEMIPHIIKHKDIFSKPLFTGVEDIKGKTLLLHSEQGYGDSIQFIRFAPQIKEIFGCKIAVKCREGLKELFSTIEEIDVIVDRSEETPQFDYQLSIMSMPFVLGMKSINDLPKRIPYLKSTPYKELEIKKEKEKINIGICWSASLTGESYEGKVFDLKFFEPLINNPKINLYSLQVGEGSEDIKKLGYEDKIIDLTPKLTDFSKTAYLMDNLDLIISSDTSVAHLAGALNRPVWVVLQKIPDWRWTNKGETTKWYPSAKLFRQKTARVWESVFQSINAKLSKQYKIKIN